MNKHIRTTLFTALALILLLTSFAGAGAANTARKGFDPKKVGGKVILSTFADPVRLLPNATNDAPSNRVMAMVYDQLLKTDIKGQPELMLATKVDVSQDKLTYTVDIRKGVKFHDGKPLTADDVVFSYEIYTDPNSINPYKSTYNMITSIKKINDYRVEFKIKEPFVFFEYSLMAGIMPKHYIKDINNFNTNTKLHRNPIGSGPFKFKEWKTAERLVLDANKDYWNGRPYMDQVIWKILPDQNVEVVNLLKKNVHFTEVVQPKSIAQVTKDKGLKTVKYDQASFNYIGWNLENPLFSDEKVREALSLGLNRQAIVDRIVMKNGVVASGPIHPLMAQYNKNVKANPYDVKKANELLDAAGWKKNSAGIRVKDGKEFAIELGYNQGNKVRESIATIAQQNWKDLGIKVTPRSYEWSIYLKNMDEGKLDAFVIGWNLGVSGDQFGIYHSSNIPKAPNFVGNNNIRLKDPKIDKILEDYRKEYNVGKRNQLYQEYHQIMNDKQYALFLYYPQGTAAMHKDLAGVKFQLWNRYWNIEDWYWSDPKMRK